MLLAFLLAGDKVAPIVLPASFGASLTGPEGINDTGEMVGLYVDANNMTHGLIGTLR